MIIRARQDGNTIVFDLEGHLDFETTLQFEQTCRSAVEGKTGPRVVFNMEKLKFVGSSGINQFIRVIKSFNQWETKPKICSLSSEFTKIFRAYQTTRNPFEIFAKEAEAIAAFDAPPPPKKAPKQKKPTIEN